MNWFKYAAYIVAIVGSWTFLVALTCRIVGLNSRTNVKKQGEQQ